MLLVRNTGILVLIGQNINIRGETVGLIWPN